MDRTIKDLKDENQLLRDGIRTITAGLNNCEYADLLSVDPDLSALDVAVGHLVAEHGHAVRQRDMANHAMVASVERREKGERRANELAAIITAAQALADKDRVDHPVYGEDVSGMVSPGWKSAMGRDLHAVLKKGMQALVDHYDSVHQRAWDNGHMVGCEETISKHMQQEDAVRAKHWREAAEYLRKEPTLPAWVNASVMLGHEAGKIERGES